MSDAPSSFYAQLPPSVLAALAIVQGPRIVTDTEAAIEAERELTAEEEAAAAELAELDADAARLDLGEFVRQGWHVLEPLDLEWNWHHEALCRNVQGMLEEWLARRDDRAFKMRWQKLVINICPSSLKSRIIMVFAVAWIWLRVPTFAWYCTSGTPANVTQQAEDFRQLVTSSWYRQTFRLKWTLRADINSKVKIKNTEGGERISKGLTAKVTGVHVDGILVDDPDDAHEVFGEASRKERVAKIQALSSRFKDKRHCIFLQSQQRLHVEDSTADAEARGGWFIARYPLHYSAARRCDGPFYADPRTVDGENLHPLRFTDQVIAEAKAELGTQGFQAQYEQNPAPTDGGMLKRDWFRFFRIAGRTAGGAPRPQGCDTGEAFTLEVLDSGGIPSMWGRLDLDALSMTVDASFGSVTETASAVAITVVGNKGVRRFVFRDSTKPRTFIDTKKAMRELLGEFPGITRVLVEKKANGAAVIEDLELEFSGFIALEVEGGKESRAAAASPAIESGCVYLLDGEHWLEDWVYELCVFPNGKRDDRVDALSQLMAYFRESLASTKLEQRLRAMQSIAAQRR